MTIKQQTHCKCCGGKLKTTRYVGHHIREGENFTVDSTEFYCTPLCAYTNGADSINVVVVISISNKNNKG